MPIVETYAERVASAAKSGEPDVYVYDELPEFLRKQISQIVTDGLGLGYNGWLASYHQSPPKNGNQNWEEIAKIMDREVQSFDLPLEQPYAYGHCIEYLKTSNDINGVLSLIEICCRKMSHLANHIPEELRVWHGIVERPDQGLEEINQRFLRAGVGYQFESGRIVRVDSEYVHAEIVKEALRLLREPGFATANDEFLKAHAHLRAGDLRDCNTAALRAMESALKVICGARGWTYNKGDTVERLIAVVVKNELFPAYLGGYFDNLVGAMKAGVPRIRDRQGGHGAGPGEILVPDHIAAYTLHLTAANIVMLVKAHKALG